MESDIEAKMGFPVTVKCGSGLTVVAVGDSFTCTAEDSESVQKTVQLTAVDVGKEKWEIID